MDIRIALAGNPNCGKTTLYNSLTGSSQYVGNWPGVTVEKNEGNLKNHTGVIVTDLPGIYSLSPYTLEEVVARNYLIIERPDVILNIIDGTNLERNLYLTTQLIEIGIPVVIAINMMDVVRKKGDIINIEKLGNKLGCKVVEISALKEEGVFEAAECAIDASKTKTNIVHTHNFSGAVEHAIAHIEEAAIHNMSDEQQRWYAIKIFERDEKVLAQLNLDSKLLHHIEEDIKSAELELDDDAESIIINERYNYVTKIIKECYTKKSNGLSTSDKIDRILTNRYLALPIFAVIMFLVYFISVSTIGHFASQWASEGVFGEGWSLFGLWIPGIPVLLERFLTSINCAVWLQSLILDGIVAGVGAVLSFVPQMFVLFLFLGFLEACGYMSRIAFVLDKIFRKFGLSGKSFIPILVGTGCGVPGIMASRTIENLRDRRMTIITTTFIPCGAKLPVIALIASSMFSGAWWVAPSAYFMGIVAIVTSGIILKKTKPFVGTEAPFIMELPAYHLPTVKNLFSTVWERVSSFIKKAGTIILVASILIWVFSRFGIVDGNFIFKIDMNLSNSIIGIISSTICWIFAPLGFGNIQATIATLMGLLAKEEIVAVFGVLSFEQMTQHAQDGLVCAYSFLIFNLLCAPCCAAIGAIKREMNSTKWTFFAIGYQTLFAYAVSLIIYQFGLVFTGNINIIGLIFAVAVLGFIIYMLVRPVRNEELGVRS